jgi:hypothetical protein
MLYLVKLNKSKEKTFNKVSDVAKVMTKVKYSLGLMYAEGKGVREEKNKELK